MTDKIPHRLDDVDYYGRRIYHITMTTEGRRPLLGILQGDPAITAGLPGASSVLPTPLGQEVLRCLMSIEHYYPQAHVVTWQLMPDHLHFIFFVTEASEAHLGQIIKGFKLGCNRAYSRLFPAAVTAPAAVTETAILSQPQKTQPQKTQPPHRPTTEERKHGQLWATSYYETPLSGKGQL